MSTAPSAAPGVGDLGPDEVLEGLARYARAAAELDWAGDAGRRAIDAARTLTTVADQVAAADAHAVEGYRRAGDWRLDGHRSPTAALEVDTGTSRARARRRCAAAKTVRDMAATWAAVACGAIAVEHQRLLADALKVARRAGMEDAFARDEKLLVDKAAGLPFDQFAQAIAYWCALVDPDGADADAIDRKEARDTHISSTTGGYQVNGWIDPIGGAEVKQEHGRIERHLFERDWAEARERVGPTATEQDLRRTAAQRRADALVEMARRSTVADVDGLAPAATPVVNIHTDDATAAAELARHEGRPYAYGAERLCELDDGTIIPPSFMLSAALAGEVRRIVYGSDGEVIDFGRRKRLATGALREALFVRDRECAHPGCHLPARRCEADHRDEWDADDGETRIGNLDCRCDFHNRWKTRSRSRWRDLSRRHPSTNRRWTPEA